MVYNAFCRTAPTKQNVVNTTNICFKMCTIKVFSSKLQDINFRDMRVQIFLELKILIILVLPNIMLLTFPQTAEIDHNKI